MSPSPLVPVEGALARPRAAPLDGVPPFGREWIFRGASGEQRDRRCLATLSTSCIEIGAPHRACHWEPLPASARPAADASVAAAAAGPASHQRRAMYVACWSVGALGIIGALIATHEPFGSSTPDGTIRTAGAVAVRAAPSTSTGPSTSAFMATPTSGGTPPVVPAPPEPAAIAPVQHAAATSAGPSAGSPHVASDISRSRTSPRATATPDTRRAAAATHPPSTHRPNGVRTTIAQARPPSLLRTAARPPISRDAPHVPGRDRRSPLPHTADALDDPLTLIAIANALGADRAAPAAPAPAAGFDWTSRLSHRRLTDTPNAFAR
ncbi:hypothetical protein WT57_07945 [Burkholderia pseudomultivorans]|uniref:Uncharacterized protein n=2 Tax=Burkholderia pseudomultivorans TaxID=1207504 RepID=A0A132F8E6_9BURK|nr:hypothetical protein [Burkholderia pseudomultivorans]KWF71637.1 hypothetical protein WT57_07945 [Burkholderia pseudomultivorans]